MVNKRLAAKLGQALKGYLDAIEEERRNPEARYILRRCQRNPSPSR